MGKKARQQRRQERMGDLIVDLFIQSVTDPFTTARDIAEAVLAISYSGRVNPRLPALFLMYSSLDYVREIGSELIDLDPGGVSALTFNAAIAPDLEQAVELLVMARARGGGPKVEEDLARLQAEFEDAKRNGCDCAP